MTTARRGLILSATLSLGAIATIASLPAHATEGYFQHGYGAISKALGGAGAAFSQDASSMATNPAGLVNVENQVNFDVSFFSPNRELTGSAGSGSPAFSVPSGNFESDNTLFLIPTIAVSYQIDDVSTVGVALYGNGGMNTEWEAMPRPLAECGGGTGVFCDGPSGVDLTQIFLQPTYAREIFDGVSVGVGPIFAAQFFEAKGVRSFGAFGFSTDPNNLSNNDHDESYGIGARFGVQAQLPANFRVGAAYQLRTYMTDFDDYAGLFAEQGSFDIPPALQAGLSWQPTESLVLLADYRRIFYSDVDSIGHSGPRSFPDIAARRLGADNGVGFGWEDINVIKFGAQFEPDARWTLRAGFSYNDNPIDSS